MAKCIDYRGISSDLLVKEAKKQWLSVEILSEKKNLFCVKWKWKEILFKSTDFGLNTALGYKIVDDKELTYKILERNNLPIAKSMYVSSSSQIDKQISNKNLKFPLIIKPTDEAHWNWVCMNILNIEELKNRLDDSFKKYENMIVQEQIKWLEYRVLVFDDEVLITWRIARIYKKTKIKFKLFDWKLKKSIS